MGRLKYNQLAKAQTKENRNVVISEAATLEGEKLGYAVSEQIVIHEGEKDTTMFLKNGLGIVSKEGLVNLRDAINKTLEQIN